MKIQLLYVYIFTRVLNTLLNKISLHHSYCYDKQPYHMSTLLDSAWILKLLTSHLKCTLLNLGVQKHVFNIFTQLLSNIGYGDSRYITLEEHLFIFLYAYVTGLLFHHLNEQSQ